MKAEDGLSGKQKAGEYFLLACHSANSNVETYWCSGRIRTNYIREHYLDISKF